MADYVLITETVPPLSQDEAAGFAVGIARALVAAKHKVSILALAEPGRAASVAGLARRLRKVPARLGAQTLELPLFEGRFSASDPTFFVVESQPASAVGRAALLGAAAVALAEDGLLKADAVLGWGETAAPALSRLQAPVKMFILPTGQVGTPLPPSEAALFDLGTDGSEGPPRFLSSVGALAAQVVVVPSPTAAAAASHQAGLDGRPSDEPVIAVRFGCDEPPHDPSADASLDARFGPDDLAGKAENRRQLARRLSLVVGPRTLLVATGPLPSGAEGRAFIDAIVASTRLDVAVVIAAGGDRVTTEAARVAAIENPAHVAVLPTTDGAAWRQALAAADAALVTKADVWARSAGLAQRYGTLPLAPDTGACADYLVDVDVASRTGSALLFQAGDATSIGHVLTRAAVLRGQADVWEALARRLFDAAPTWTAAAAQIETLRASVEHDETVDAA